MVEEVAADAATSIPINLLSTGIGAGAQAATSQIRSYLRRDDVSPDLGEVATEFHKALEEGIKAENQQRDSLELAGFTDRWQAIVEELAATPAGHSAAMRHDAEEVDILFTDETQAVGQIADAYAEVENLPLEEMPQAREAIQQALTRAYRRAVEDFQDRIDGTELEQRFNRETNLVLAERLSDLQDRLALVESDVRQILTQAAYDEGFRQLSRTFFSTQSSSPEQCWRVGFSLADVEADIPATREGINQESLSKNLLETLRDGTNQMVVGRPGAGKSTLCKQVAVEWYRAENLGAVLYRETGTGTQFTSTDAFTQVLDRAQQPVLVVVEDAIRDQANTIAEIIEEFEADPGVRFLLDARQTELDEFETAGSLDVSADRRRASVLENMERHSLPPLSVTDVQNVCTAFTEATGRKLRRDPTALHEQLRTKTEPSIGDMLLLTFLLPATGERQDSAGLSAHVRMRYETLTPEGDESNQSLEQFDDDLLADVGVMVSLLNASEIGVHQELVHALSYEHGNDIKTHDAIEAILEALEGWVLFPTNGSDVSWRTHPLWSALYLRELAQEHAERQASSRRADRSESRVATCLTSLFQLFDDPAHREALSAEFPESLVLAEINANPQDRADEYLEAIFELGKQWPVLAVLFGTTDTAQYSIPDAASEFERTRAVTKRGHAHRSRGAYAKAASEFTYRLQQSRDNENRRGIARSLRNLGVVAREQGTYDDAKEHLNKSLDLFKELNHRSGVAKTLKDLGVVAIRTGDYTDAQEYLEQSLGIFDEVNDRGGIAVTFGSLGLVAEERGNYDQACTYHRKCLNISEELGDRTEIANSLNNLGVVALRQDRHTKAQEHFENSLDMFEQLGERGGIADSLGNLGVVAREQQEYDDAWDYFKDTNALFEEMEDRGGIAYSLYNLGLIARAQGNYDQARDHLEESLNEYRELGATRRELLVRRNLIKLERDVEALDRASERCEAAKTRCEEFDIELSKEREKLETLCEDIHS